MLSGDNCFQSETFYLFFLCESNGSIINTIGHELLHVVSHICEQDGIDMLSEEPCYMMGSLCEKFFDVSSVNNVN